MDLGSLESFQKRLGGSIPEQILSRIAESVGRGVPLTRRFC